MKSIGFVDFYISEWHANNYPGWIKEVNDKIGTDYEVKYAWAEQDISPVDGVSTEQWCRQRGVIRCETIAELCEKSDAIIILAPSNPEKHLQYAKEVLPFGKRTYIDKTFAPDLKTAEEIFRIAKEHECPFFSTSALRYAQELEEFHNAKDYFIAGGGSNFNEYIIHTVEMAVVLLDEAVNQVKVDCVGTQRICHLTTISGREAVIGYSPAVQFSIAAENSQGVNVQKEVVSPIFPNLIERILQFFEDGIVPFDARQTLEVMKIRTALLEAEQELLTDSKSPLDK